MRRDGVELSLRLQRLDGWVHADDIWLHADDLCLHADCMLIDGWVPGRLTWHIRQVAPPSLVSVHVGQFQGSTASWLTHDGGGRVAGPCADGSVEYEIDEIEEINEIDGSVEYEVAIGCPAARVADQRSVPDRFVWKTRSPNMDRTQVKMGKKHKR